MKYNFSEETKIWLGYHTKNSLYEILCEEREKISKLEEENAKLQNKIDAFNYAKSTVDYWACRDKKVEEFKEQLKNAIVPKFRVGQKVWFILKDNKGKDVFCGEVLLITLNGYYQPPKLIYTIIQFDKEWRCEEKSLFATEAEAQKYLEGRK